MQRLVFLLALLVACLALTPAARAQQNDPSSESSAMPPRPMAEVRELPLPVYHAYDSRGRLVPVPSLSLEELGELIQDKINRQQGTTAPSVAHSLESVKVTGEVKEGVALLEAHFEIKTQAPGWIAIPLGLSEAALREAPACDGPAERKFVTYDPKGDGFVVWLLAAQEEQEHRVTLKLAANVVSEGSRSHLTFRVAQTVRGELQVRVPGRAVEATAGALALGPIRPLEGGTSEGSGLFVSEINGLFHGGEVRLAWQGAVAAPAESPLVLDCTGVVHVMIDSSERVVSDARFEVRSYTRPIDTLWVRLPPGMQLVPQPQKGYAVTASDEAPGGGSATQESDAGVWTQVRFEQPARGPLEVRLRCQTARGPERRPFLEPAAFEVLHAARGHTGHVVVTAKGDWAAQFIESGPGVHRVEELPDDLRQSDMVAGYQYFHQPCPLKLQVLRKGTQMVVEPQYSLYLEAGQARLAGRLRYRAGGARPELIGLDLAGWELDKLLPPHLVNMDSPASAGAGPLYAPLTLSDARDFEIVFTARRAWDAPASGFSLPLPAPVDVSARPASLAVYANVNIELAPRHEKMPQLLAAAPPADWLVPPEAALPAEGPPTLFYRQRSVAEGASFSFDATVREQKIVVEVDNSIRLDQRRATVRQVFAHQIFYEWAYLLAFDMPAAARNVRFTLDGQPLAHTMQAGPSNAPGRQRAQTRLPRATLKECVVVAEYEIPLPPASDSSEQPRQAPLPLAMPVVDERVEVGRIAARVTAPSNWRLELLGEHPAWRVEEAEFDPVSSLSLAGEGALHELPLEIAAAQSRPRTAASVLQAWVQTWLAEGVRQDRAALRVQVNGPRFELALPRGVGRNEVLEVSLNGSRLEYVPMTAARDGAPQALVIETHSPGEHVVEAVYTLPQGQTSWGSQQAVVEFPTVAGAAGPTRAYWQLVTAGDQHLVQPPEGWTSELQWQWKGFYWVRQAAMSQRELEHWLGVASRPEAPSDAHNYLFSAFGGAPAVRALTARRQSVVLIASGVTLLYGLALIYLPWLRRGASLAALSLATALGVALFASWRPDLALLGAQASALGLGLALLAAILARRFEPAPATPSSVTHLRGSSIATPTPKARAARGSSLITTTTAPAAVTSAPMAEQGP